MPSFLGSYDGAASGREMKFIRAVNSFCENTYDNKLLIIVSDGCDITNELYDKYNNIWDNVILVKIPKQPLFSGNVRQAGLDASDSDYIAYLDTDDTIGKNHLSNVVEQLHVNDLDFCWFNDFVKTGHGAMKGTRIAKMEYGHCGTSTIAHRSKFSTGYKPTWSGCDSYGHDYDFIRNMKENTTKHKKINGCMYLVHHVKGTEINF